MIDLCDITRAYRTPAGVQVVLNGLNLTVGHEDRVGILGAGQSGKSTLMRIIAGIERADSGDRRVTARTLWPLGSSHGFHPDLTGEENVRALSRIAGLNPTGAAAFCETFAELGPYFQRPVGQFSPGMRAQLAFSFSMAGRPQIYLADEIISAGDQRFRDKCEALLVDRLQSAGLVLVSKHARTLDRFCSRFFALINGQLLPCDSGEDAARLLTHHSTGKAA